MEPNRKPIRFQKRNLEVKLNRTEKKAPSTCYLLPLYLTLVFWSCFKDSGVMKAAIVALLTRKAGTSAAEKPDREKP